MLKIKVGQIWRVYDDYSFMYIITKRITKSRKDGTIEKIYQAICNDGFCFEELKEKEVLQDYLIAEYPTWQEAVNSKEFNNVAED